MCSALVPFLIPDRYKQYPKMDQYSRLVYHHCWCLHPYAWSRNVLNPCVFVDVFWLTSTLDPAWRALELGQPLLVNRPWPRHQDGFDQDTTVKVIMATSLGRAAWSAPSYPRCQPAIVDGGTYEPSKLIRFLSRETNQLRGTSFMDHIVPT